MLSEYRLQCFVELNFQHCIFEWIVIRHCIHQDFVIFLVHNMHLTMQSVASGYCDFLQQCIMFIKNTVYVEI